MELQIGDVVTGTVVSWFDRTRAFGFARVANVDKDVFIAASRLTNAGYLAYGDRVQFEVRLDDHGRLFADGVELLNDDQAVG